MSLVPTWPIAVGALILGLVAGYGVEHKLRTAEVDKINLKHERALNLSKDELAKANKAARDHEHADTVAFAALATKYEESRQNEKATDAATITALRNDVVRLRVSTNSRPAGGSQLPATTAGACTGDGQTEQTLAPTVAARLAGRYAEYNEIVDQLGLCQDVLLSERKNLATQP